jgi:hypothetical protein
MEFILFILFFCGCGGGEFVYFVPFHFFSTAREFPLVTQNTPVGTRISWPHEPICHRLFFFLSQPTNPPLLV